LTFQARFIIVFDLTLKQKCVKQYKQLKYNLEMCMNQIKSNKILLKELNSHISKDE